MSLYSFSFADTMLSLRSFFQVIPHETAVARFAAEGKRAEISDFCGGIVLGMVQAVEIPFAPAPPRPVGPLCGNFMVTQLVEKVPAQAVVPPKLKKQYKKWGLEHQQMVLDIDKEKGSDRVAVSVLRESWNYW